MSAVRLGLAVVAFVLAAGSVPYGLFRLLDAYAVKPVEVGLDVIEQIDLPATPWPESDAESAHVAFLGDSMIISYPPNRRVPERLQERLDALANEARPIRVHSVAAPGNGAFDYYFLADLVAAAQPDVVILPVNLTSFSDIWRGTFSRPELAGFIDPSRLPHALALPLDWVGVTADRLLGGIALIQAGGFEAWRELAAQQARLGSALTLLTRTLGDRFGGNADKRFSRESFIYLKHRMVVAKTQRLTPEGTNRRFGKALAGIEPSEPTLQVLAAAIRTFRDQDIEVVVYTNPTNVEHLESIAAADSLGLAETLSSIEEVSRRAGAHFVDLHDLLPNQGFRDFAGHLAFRGDVPDGPLLLAEKLAPVVVQSVND